MVIFNLLQNQIVKGINKVNEFTKKKKKKRYVGYSLFTVVLERREEEEEEEGIVFLVIEFLFLF